MIFTRGLAALIITLVFSLSLQAEFLYKDDVVHNDKFTDEIEKIGQELHDKTGISLYLVMVRDLDENQSTVDFEKSLVSELHAANPIITIRISPA